VAATKHLERKAMRHDKHVAYRATQDRALRDELVLEYEGFASALAWRFGGGRDVEDLRQVALIGLLRAVERFDPEHGTEFLTFAWAVIIGALRRHRRDTGSPVRMSRSLQTKTGAVARSLDQVTQALGRSPTVPELAAAAGLSVEEVIEGMEARSALEPLSIDVDLGRGGALSVSGDEEIDRIETRELLGPLVARLPAREQEIIRLRFSEERSQAEIAALVGISQMHVSRLLARSLQQLRDWVGDDDDAT
jgi:RNA polymerase sigma-B factor